MSSTSTPYGLIPIKKLGGVVYNGAFNQWKIASAYGTDIFMGDVVNINPGAATGTIIKDTGTTTATPIGVFLGCTYTDPNLNYKVHRNYWPASTVATDALAYVCDDPDMIFKIQGDGAGVIFDQTNIGSNAALVQGSGSSTTGISGVSLDSSSATTTAALPLKIIDYDRGPSNAIDDTYVDFHVIFNTHQWRTLLGVATS
jgi:hypothetical protein